VAFLLGDLPRRIGADRLKGADDVDLAPLIDSRYDRTTVDEDRRNVHSGKTHHRSGNCLVTATDAQQSVHLVAVSVELDNVRNCVPGDEGRLHSLVAHRLAVGDDEGMEAHRHGAEFFQALLGDFRELVVVDVTGADVTSRAGNANDWLHEVVVAKADGPEHRPVGRPLDALGHHP
jgi:hypothetical protein